MDTIGEWLSLVQWHGGTLILLAIVMVVRGQRATAAPVPSASPTST